MSGGAGGRADDRGRPGPRRAAGPRDAGPGSAGLGPHGPGGPRFGGPGHPGPFRVRCLLCGTVAESWHRAFPAPPGATIDMAPCACGHVTADSMGVRGQGRILTKPRQGDGDGTGAEGDVDSFEVLPPT